VWFADFTQTHPGEQTTGAAATFDQARADFEDAWKVLLSKRTEADFQAWRDNRDWTDALILVGRPTMFARIGVMRSSTVPADGNLPPNFQFEGKETLYRLTSAGWSAIHRSGAIAVCALLISALSFTVAIVGRILH
jgi:hypothetical protein